MSGNVWKLQRKPPKRKGVKKGMHRKWVAARHASFWALFCADYHRHHGKLPPTDLTKAERIKFRNRELARYAGRRSKPPQCPAG